MSHPILFITTHEAPGILYINGQLCGELEESLTLPVSPNGAVFLEYRPLTPEYLPFAMRLDFVGGEPKIPRKSHPNVKITVWPGGYVDIDLLPSNTDSLSPIALKRAEWPDGTSAELVSKRGSLYLQIGDFSHRLPDGAAYGSLALAGELLCAHGPCSTSGEYMTAISREDGFRVVFEAFGRRVHLPEGDGPILVERAANDFVGHLQTHIYSPDYSETGSVWREVSIRQSFEEPGPSWPQTPEETARAFIEAVAVGASEEAAGYLASGINAKEAFARLGDVESCVSLKYPPPPVMPVIMGAVSSPRPDFILVSAFGFELAPRQTSQGAYQITSMRPLG